MLALCVSLVFIVLRNCFSLYICIRYYGGTLSEQVLGKALKTIPLAREKYVVSSKCGRYIDGFDFSADRVTKSVDESLKRLNLDYIDILQCHDIEFGSLDQVSSNFSKTNLCCYNIL